MINRGMEVVAQRRGFDLLILVAWTATSTTAHLRAGPQERRPDPARPGAQPEQLDRLSRQVPIVTLAGVQTPTTTNVGGDNVAGMRAIARHLVLDHGLRTLAYLGGHATSPDSITRHAAFSAAVTAPGRPSPTARSGRATTSRRAAPG